VVTDDLDQCTYCRSRLLRTSPIICVTTITANKQSNAGSIHVCILLVFNQLPRSTQPSHPSWLGAMSTSGRRGVNRHGMRYSSLVLVTYSVCWCLAEHYRNTEQCRPMGPCCSGRTLLFFTTNVK